MKLKLSNLTYGILQSAGVKFPHMHTDATDCLRYLSDEDQFERAKADLRANYGDVTIVLEPDAPWYDRIRIDDAKWQADHQNFCRRKSEFCMKYGSE